MEYDPKTPWWEAQYNTGDRTSFANESVFKRWPVIITGAIDDLHRACSKAEDPEKQTEGRALIEQLASLKYEALHDRRMTPLPDDGFTDDINAYNKELEQRNPTWMNVAWLYGECYLYRRISALFQLSKHWKNYDIFANSKSKAFRTSRDAILELAAQYKTLIQELEKKKDATHDVEAEKLLFIEMAEICLWGNATDLSLLPNLSYEDIQKLQGSEARKTAENNILVNDLPAAFDLLKKAQADGKVERRVDIVLDNAGFELYVDLVLAGYLLSSGLATQIIIHPKSIPWYVSDVLPTDFSDLLNSISNPRAFFETQSEDEALQDKTPTPLSDAEVENMQFLFQEWISHHAEGRLVMRPNRYWTAAGSFWRLPAEEPELHKDLQESELVIFKGDLNYRKLTADAMWDPTTPFPESLGPMGPGSGVNVLSLRTCKADVVVGLPAGKDEELRQTEGGGGDTGARRWAWSGKWAVVSLSLGS